MHTAQQLQWQNFGQICFHERHPIPRPYRRSMGYLSWVILRKMTAIYRERTVPWYIFIPWHWIFIWCHLSYLTKSSIRALYDRDNMATISQTTLSNAFSWIKFVPKGPINNIPALVQIMAWRPPGDKQLSEAMMISLLTHICVTRPQWVNGISEPHMYIINREIFACESFTLCAWKKFAYLPSIWFLIHTFVSYCWCVWCRKKQEFCFVVDVRDCFIRNYLILVVYFFRCLDRQMA